MSYPLRLIAAAAFTGLMVCAASCSEDSTATNPVHQGTAGSDASTGIDSSSAAAGGSATDADGGGGAGSATIAEGGGTDGDSAAPDAADGAQAFDAMDVSWYGTDAAAGCLPRGQLNGAEYGCIERIGPTCPTGADVKEPFYDMECVCNDFGPRILKQVPEPFEVVMDGGVTACCYEVEQYADVACSLGDDGHYYIHGTE